MMHIRAFHALGEFMAPARSALRPIPKPSEKIPDVNTFLSKIGRKCNEFSEVFENEWNNLFKWDSKTLKEKGVPAQQRKYILKQVEVLRRGAPVTEHKQGKKSFFGGERKRKEQTAKWRAQQRNEA